MEITQTTVPGAGALHDLVTRDGQHFRIFVARSGVREVYAYDPAHPDVAVATIVLEEDEADRIAEILQSRPIADRLSDLERRFSEFAGSGRERS